MLYLDAGINGLANGCIETGVNVWLLEIWSTKSSPFMQALHFCFSLGIYCYTSLRNKKF